MDTGSFGGFAAFFVVAVITGTIGYLAVQQAKIKRQIEESRRQNEMESLTTLGGFDPGVQGTPPQILPGMPPDGPADAHPDHPPDTGGHHTPDAGGHH